MTPTKDRNHSGVFIKHLHEGILVDCGENIQRQMKVAGLSLAKVTRILISHWHGDHTLGLPGLIQSMNAAGYPHTLHVYGPKGTKKRFGYMYQAFAFDDRSIRVELHEIEEGIVFETRELTAAARLLDHGIDTYGYEVAEKDRRRIDLKKAKALLVPHGPLMGKLQAGERIKLGKKTIKPEDATYVVKGKKVAFIADTALCDGCYALAKDADALISESTFLSDMEEKSREYKHMTSRDAAMVAKKAGAKKLYLTHFSSRYKDTKLHEKDAKAIFKDTMAARDFLKVEV
ncbi:TPA: ribonuclease Z [Candidatus Woesearchaeota archaeon]|nr:ribonuclease Z [Candidatus Woesearchaeota archaeon]